MVLSTTHRFLNRLHSTYMLRFVANHAKSLPTDPHSVVESVKSVPYSRAPRYRGLSHRKEAGNLLRFNSPIPIHPWRFRQMAAIVVVVVFVPDLADYSNASLTMQGVTLVKRNT
jgi:hypothetical protein